MFVPTVFATPGAENGIPEEATSNEQGQHGQEESHIRATLKVLLEGDGGHGDPEKQEGESEDNQSRSLHRLRVRIALPQKRIDTPASAKYVRPDGRTLPLFQIRAKLFDVSWVFHLALPQSH
ncbi:MAG: hypothetical protein WCE75_08190 [Terracidiphilus sp.]